MTMPFETADVVSHHLDPDHPPPQRKQPLSGPIRKMATGAALFVAICVVAVFG
eukprot:CAMPEP_0201273384 /NCGR_PEP_ID=MMETSP0853-20130426/45110_1 /ASSEMBLY_ACC=CAM_ASM_000640 /TAXON_ID=183588 /ORGANISM="Pseudo-nitzschia fraudulenta, Strain WWA7" /LENGTH=52 /DNA_ID=CAMNT_0047580505 /DNA_START=30 /DNA_END=186 /DNA_ORIENTATION=+